MELGLHLGLTDETKGIGTGPGGTPDNAVINRDGAFVINRNGDQLIADPTPRTS